jgi:hypothetical protein
VILAYLLGLPLPWLLCARLGYRVAVRREWLAAMSHSGGEYTRCPDYRDFRHPATGCCAKCAARPVEDFRASRRNRAMLALAGAPLLLLALAATLLVTGRQPLSAGERDHRLKQAEEDLRKATDELAALQKREAAS